MKFLVIFLTIKFWVGLQKKIRKEDLSTNMIFGHCKARMLGQIEIFLNIKNKNLNL